MVEYVKLGRTNQVVSRLGLGTMAFGGLYGPMPKIDVVRTVHAAIDLGITFFDTSPTYGDGRAEELLAEALGNHIDRVFIATKNGTGSVSDLNIWRSNDRESIIKRVEGSLRRLKRDHIDLYMIYGPDPHTPVKETMETLVELRQAGKIRFIGTCEADTARLRDELRYGRIEAVEAPYNVMNRMIENEVLPFCRAAGISVIASEPFLCGLLHGELHRNSVFDITDHRVLDKRFRGQRYRDNVEAVNRLRKIAEQQGVSLTQLALGWVLRNETVSVAVCGAKSAQQIRHIATNERLNIVDDQLFFIDQSVGERTFESMGGGQ
ncbi:MAG: aldo/keto reductase [Bacteroidota bacterium]